MPEEERPSVLLGGVKAGILGCVGGAMLGSFRGRMTQWSLSVGLNSALMWMSYSGIRNFVADRWQEGTPDLLCHSLASSFTGLGFGMLYGGYRAGVLWAGLALGTTTTLWLTQGLWKGALQWSARKVKEVGSLATGRQKSREIVAEREETKKEATQGSDGGATWIPSWVPIRPLDKRQYQRKLEEELRRLEREEGDRQREGLQSEGGAEREPAPTTHPSDQKQEINRGE